MLLLGCLPRGLGAAPAPGLPEDLETRLALSALPPQLRDEATVYRLDPRAGFVPVREGSNGFHALVARNDPAIYQAPWSHDAWEDLLIPIAFDAAGAGTVMRAWFDVARYRAEGMAPAAAQRSLRESYVSEYVAPPRAGIAYMLGPVVRGYRHPERGPEVVTFSLPHTMVYAPGLTNADIGGGPALDHPFVLSEVPGPHNFIIVLAGAEERRAIREAYAADLARLCELDARLCLPEAAH